MKAILIVAVVAATLAVSAADLKINGDFKGSKLNAVQPSGWTKNFANNKDIGISKMIPGKEVGEFELSVKSTTRDMPFYSGLHEAKTGDILKVEADIKGSGRISFSYYAYDAKGNNVGVKRGKIQVVKTAGKFKDEIVISPIKDKTVSAIRVVFSAHPNSDVVFRDIEAEIHPPVQK